MKVEKEFNIQDYLSLAEEEDKHPQQYDQDLYDNADIPTISVQHEPVAMSYNDDFDYQQSMYPQAPVDNYSQVPQAQQSFPVGQMGHVNDNGTRNADQQLDSPLDFHQPFESLAPTPEAASPIPFPNPVSPSSPFPDVDYRPQVHVGVPDSGYASSYNSPLDGGEWADADTEQIDDFISGYLNAVQPNQGPQQGLGQQISPQQIQVQQEPSPGQAPYYPPQSPIHDYGLNADSPSFFASDQSSPYDSLQVPGSEYIYGSSASESGYLSAPSSPSLSPATSRRRSSSSGEPYARPRSYSNPYDHTTDASSPGGSPGLTSGYQRRRTKKSPSLYPCEMCDKKFTRAYNLRSHMRTHTHERPFACSVCGKAFARQHDRKRHEILHTGEKKYVCEGTLADSSTWGCGRRFARADALGRHFRTEAGKLCIAPLREDIIAKQGQVDNISEQIIFSGFVNGAPQLTLKYNDESNQSRRAVIISALSEQILPSMVHQKGALD